MSFLPANRLLLAVALVLPLAILAGPWPELTPVWLLALGGVGLLALADLIRHLREDDGLRLVAPEVLRFTKDRPGELELVLAHPGGPLRRVRLGVGLPPAFRCERDDAWLELPREPGRVRVAWPCVPTRRGCFREIAVALERTTSLGLWRLRRRLQVPCELRVYPNLFSERKQLAALFLARGRDGTRLQRMVGRGRDFDKLREYLPGDGYDEIHWKATAKRGRPITKVFQAERTQEIYVIIDASRLSGRAVTHEGITQTVLERYLTAALVLLLAAEQQGDRFGLIVYDDRVRVFVKAGAGEGHYAACRDAIHALQPSEATPDMAEIVRYIRTSLRRRALLFILTDLGDPVLAEDFLRNARLLSRQHLVMVNQLQPPGVGPLFADGELAEPGQIYGKVAGHERWLDSQHLIRKLKPLGVAAAILDDEAMATRLVAQYLAVKQRQML